MITSNFKNKKKKKEIGQSFAAPVLRKGPK